MRYLFTIVIVFITIYTYGQKSLDFYPIKANYKSNPHALSYTGYFIANDSAHGYELWHTGKSYKSSYNPVRVSDIQKGTADGIYPSPYYLSNHGSIIYKGNTYLYFVGYYKDGSNTKRGLYEYNLQDSTAVIVDSNTHTVSYFNNQIFSATSTLYFTGMQGSAEGLFKYDITTKKVSIVRSFKLPPPQNKTIHLYTRGNNIFYIAQNGPYTELHLYNNFYNTDTTIADTSFAKGQVQNVHSLTILNTYIPGQIKSTTMLYYCGQTANYGFELYRYDYPNSSAPVRLTDANPGSGDGVHSIFFSANGKTYFRGSNGSVDDALFYYYEYAKKTVHVPYPLGINTPIAPDSLSPKILNSYGNDYVLVAKDDNGDEEVVLTQLSNQVPINKLDVNSGIASSNPRNLISNDVYLVYFATRGNPPEDGLVVYNDPSVSVKEINKLHEATLYPNPTNDNATLSISLDKMQNIAIQLVDINGRVVFAKEAVPYNSGTHNITLPTQQLAAGTYIYTLKDNKGATLYNGLLIKE